MTVLGVRGNQIRIGIDAPKDVSVHRLEVYQRIQAEKNDLEDENDFGTNKNIG